SLPEGRQHRDGYRIRKPAQLGPGGQHAAGPLEPPAPALAPTARRARNAAARPARATARRRYDCMNTTDWLGIETEWRPALVSPARARCAAGETAPAAEWAAYRAAVAWGRSRMFGVALGDWDGVLALPLARAAARRLTESLRGLRHRADNLSTFWTEAD